MSDTWYICDDGISRSLNAITGFTPTNIGGGTVRLFGNNITVSNATTSGNLVIQSFPGTSAVALNSNLWAAATTSAHIASATYGGAVIFSRNQSGTSAVSYGMALTDNPFTKLYGCCNFANGSYNLTTSGDNIVPTLTFTHRSLN